MKHGSYCSLALFLATVLLGHASGQNPEQSSSGLALRADAIDFAVPGYRAGRQGAPATGVRLHDITFEGQSFPANRLHIQQLSEGVYELLGEADRVGTWRLALNDAADGYYGLGERFNELNHTHQVIRNGSQDNGGSKGSATYKPIPFYMSTTGYGLWVDTTAEAVFDLNAASREDVLITVPAQKLRIVLIQGPEFPRILDRFTAMAGRSMLPPYWSFAPWIGRDYHRNDGEVREDMEKSGASACRPA